MTQGDLETAVIARRERRSIAHLAVELGLTHHQLRDVMRASGIGGQQECRGGPIWLLPADAQALHRVYREHTERHRAGVPLSLASTELGLPVAALEALIGQGVLGLAEPCLPGGMRRVTRASLAAYAEARRAPQRLVDSRVTLSSARARAVTGLTRSGLAALVRDGTFVAVGTGPRGHLDITVASIEAWAHGSNLNEVLACLARVQRESQASTLHR